MQEHMCALGEIVKKTRLELKLTQDEVAERVGVEGRTIMKIENQKGNPKMEVLFPLIRELRIDPTCVFYPEMERKSASITRFNILLSQCTDEEVQSLLPVCEAVLNVLRSSNTIVISEE